MTVKKVYPKNDVFTKMYKQGFTKLVDVMCML